MRCKVAKWTPERTEALRRLLDANKQRGEDDLRDDIIVELLDAYEAAGRQVAELREHLNTLYELSEPTRRGF